MKKLNRKGFTLVELLAVIVILAIVVGISIPSVTGMINSSKNDSMEVALNQAQKYLTDQYSYVQLGIDSYSTEFKTKYDAGAFKLDESVTTLKSADDTALLKQMGFEKADVLEVEVTFDSKANACVKVTKILKGSKFHTAKYWSADANSTPLAGAKNKSSNCA